MSVEIQYAAYVYQFGYAPAQPGHLISFAKKNGVKIKFTEAKLIIKAKPDTSDYVPPPNADGSNSPLPAKVKSEDEKKQERRETAKRYSTNKLEIDSNTLNIENKIVGRSKRASANRYAFLLNQLTSKGWQKEPALAALKQANGNVLLAEEALMNVNKSLFLHICLKCSIFFYISKMYVTPKQGGSIKSGPDWAYSNGKNGAGIKDRINKFNQSGNDEPHALDGAKWITKYRNNNASNDESQQSQNNGYKRNVNNNQPNGIHYNGLLDFDQNQPNAQQQQYQQQQQNSHANNAEQFQPEFQGQSTGAQFNNYGQNNNNPDNKSQFQQQSQGVQYNNNNGNNSQFEQQSQGVQYNNYNNNTNNNDTNEFQGQSTGSQYNNYGNNNNNSGKSKFQGQSTGSQYNNYGNNNNNNSGKSEFQGQSTGSQYNNYGNNNNNSDKSHFQGQSTGATYNNNNNKQKQDINVGDVNVSFERLLSGHASIKHRLQAMDNIYMKLEELDISSDCGKVLLSCYTEQVLHEDYIYRDFAVRIKAIQQISDVFIYCLNRVHFQDIPNIIMDSLPDILDALYKLMDDNRAKKFHEMCKQCVIKILDAIIGKRSREATIGLAGYLNEKINCENITQAHPRFFTAKQLFESIIFGNTSNIINNLFNIDINGWNNKIPKWKQGVDINESTDLPQDRQWFNLLIANNFNNNDDETFKDIITDCLSIMMLDPNPDISLIGNNLTVFFQQFNGNFSNSLETEAKYRFNKFYIPQPKQTSTLTSTSTNHQSEPLRPLKPVENQNNYQKFKQQHSGEADHYRIKQETKVSIGAPTLPSI